MNEKEPLSLPYGVDGRLRPPPSTLPATGSRLTQQFGALVPAVSFSSFCLGVGATCKAFRSAASSPQRPPRSHPWATGFRISDRQAHCTAKFVLLRWLRALPMQMVGRPRHASLQAVDATGDADIITPPCQPALQQNAAASWSSWLSGSQAIDPSVVTQALVWCSLQFCAAVSKAFSPRP